MTVKFFYSLSSFEPELFAHVAQVQRVVIIRKTYLYFQVKFLFALSSWLLKVHNNLTGDLVTAVLSPAQILSSVKK